VSGSSAMCLAYGNRQSMKLVEEPRLVFLIIGRKGQTRECSHGAVCLAVIDGRGLEKLVALGDAAQILIGDGDGMAEGVKQNGVGCLGADAGQGQQACAQGGCGAGGEAIERTRELLVEHRDEGFERGRLARVKAGGLNEALQLFDGERAQAVDERAFDGFPCGVLREVGAEDDFKGSFCGPPMLGAIGLEEPIVHPAQSLGGSGFGRGHGWT